MSRTYIALSIVFIVIALGLVLLPDIKRDKQLEPEALLKEIIDPSRYINPDRVADRLINEDPTIFLVDVRTSEEFNSYTLPGAVNIPIQIISEPDNEDFLNTDNKDVVIFSNDDLYADQAWIICTRMGYRNLFVMKGGLNQWFHDIILPVPPSEPASREEHDLYTFRKAAGLYFTGGDIIPQNAENKEKINLKKREKKTTTEGGC